MTQPLPWTASEAFDYRWTEKAYDLLVAGDITAEVRVVGGVELGFVNGPCPRCEHMFSGDRLRMAVTAGGGVLGEETSVESSFTEVDLWCDCGQEHAGRPEEKTEGKTGCGVAYRVPARKVTP